VGETEARYLDIRIIAATNRNLQQAMHEGRFREDLYYRLNTFHLQLPPLRERKPVIPNLIRYFILKNKESQGKEIHDLDPAALYALTKYPYPGNIRELENIMEHAIVLSEGGIIKLEDLPEYVQVEAREKTVAIPHIKDNNVVQSNVIQEDFIRGNVEDEEEIEKSIDNPIGEPISFIPVTGKTDNAGLLTHNPTKYLTHNTAPVNAEAADEEILSLEEMERRHILHALSICKGNKTEVCKRLGISRATLWRKLKELKIEMDGGEEQ
jgi:two-component system nitrogen regulation response regulator GlnG